MSAILKNKFGPSEKRGIKLLLCDIDNTLVAYNDPDSNAKVKRFLRDVEAHGIQVALCSNAAPARAKRFARILTWKKCTISRSSRWRAT